MADTCLSLFRVWYLVRYFDFVLRALISLIIFMFMIAFEGSLFATRRKRRLLWLQDCCFRSILLWWKLEIILSTCSCGRCSFYQLISSYLRPSELDDVWHKINLNYFIPFRVLNAILFIISYSIIILHLFLNYKQNLLFS